MSRVRVKPMDWALTSGGGGVEAQYAGFCYRIIRHGDHVSFYIISWNDIKHQHFLTVEAAQKAAKEHRDMFVFSGLEFLS